MLLTWYFTRPRSGCLTDLQPLQQQQNSVNKANNTVAGKTNNSGKLGSPSSNDNTASPMDSASVTTPAVLTKEARGRVTRSSLGKAPLSLKSCEQVIWTLSLACFSFFGLTWCFPQLQNEFNIQDGVHGREAAATSASSPPTPHKIIRWGSISEPTCNLNLHHRKPWNTEIVTVFLMNSVAG